MALPRKKPRYIIEIIGLTLFIIIFISELLAPNAVPYSMLYIMVLFLFLRASHSASVIAAALLSMILVIAGNLSFPISLAENENSTLLSKFFLIVIIGGCAAVILKYKNKELQLENNVEELFDYKYALDEGAIVAITNQKGVIQKVNQNFVKISKYTRQELIGKDHNIIRSGYHSRDFIRNLWVTIANGKIWKGELKNKAKDGSTYWVDTTIIPFLDKQNKPYQYLAIRFDITSRKSVEEELVKQNEELAKYIYISSHDLQEPLRKIQTLSNLILDGETTNLSEDGKRYLDRMSEAAKRMREQLEDLLKYSSYNSNVQKSRDTDLQVLLNDVKAELHKEILDKDATVTFSGLSILHAVPHMLHHLFLSLIGNSLKFSQTGIASQIFISCSRKKGADLQNNKLQKEKDYFHIEVKDNGIGFDTQYKERIFEVFQRLNAKEDYKGTGIGLAIVKRIVEYHHGLISAESEVLVGTTFKIDLPA